MATRETLEIIIRADGSRVVRRNIEEIGQAASGADRTIKLLTRSLAGIATGAIATGAIVNGLRSIADEYVNIQNRLRVSTRDQANLNAVFNELQSISTATRSSLASNVELYSRLSLAAKELGTSQAEILDFTTKVNKAIKISGATAQEAEAGLIQLSQGLASGTLRGDELRSVLEQLPGVADIISKGLGVTRGQLRLLGEQGKITAQAVLDSFKKVGPELDEKFNKTVATSAEGFVVLRNQVVETVGKVNEALGATSSLGQGMVSLTGIIKDMTDQFIGAARAITGTLDPMDQLSTGTKVFATIAVTLVGILKLVAITVKTVVFTAFNALGNLIGGLGASLGKFGEGLVETFSTIGDIVSATIRGELDTLPDNLFGEAGKRFAESDKAFKDAFVDSGQIIVDGFKAGDAELIDSASFTVEKLVKIWDEGARQVQDRKADAVGVVSTKTGPKGATATTPQELKALEKLQNQLRGLLNEIDPLSGAALEFEKAQTILNKAAEKGLITGPQLVQFTANLEQKYRDIFDPLSKLNREMDQQNNLLSLATREREVESQILQIANDLKEQGVKLTLAETQALRDKLTASQELQRITDIRDQQVAGSREGQRQGFTDQVTAAKQNLSDPTTGFGKSDAFATLTQGQEDLFAGSQEAMDLQVQRFADMYSRIAALRDADIISEQTAQAARTQVWIKSHEESLATASDFFGQLAQLSRSENSKIAAIGKAAAIAQAVINTYQAATAAYASLAAIPVVGPALGAAAAGAAIVAGLANVNAIRRQPTGFRDGGYTGNGGLNEVAGVVHGREFVMNAEATARNRPLLQAMNSGASVGGKPAVNVKIENYGTSKGFEVQQVDANQIRIIARDEARAMVRNEAGNVVAAQMSNPNSNVSKSLNRNTTSQRKRN